MELKEIYSNLCYYDVRNTESDLDSDEIEYYHKNKDKNRGCYCDNCFYGRTKLANKILELLNK